MARKRFSIVDFYNPEAPFATEFRRLLQRIQNDDTTPELKSILVTSAMLSEGKSTICSFLGITSAVHKGLKTLIVDADLRRPNIHTFFMLERDYGLMEILTEGFNPREAIKKTTISKLDILTSGKHINNPSTVFDAESIGNLVEEMKFYYDLILVDSPPIIPVSDPMLLSTRLDGILIVVKAGSTQQEVSRRAIEIINHNRKKIIGVVLNDVNRSLPFQYDYRYYGYEYNYKPGKSKNSATKKKEHKKKKSRGDKASFENKTK